VTLEEVAKLHTLAQIATAARVGRVTVWNWIRRGVAGPSGPLKLAAVKVGGRYLVDPDSLAAFIAARDAPPVVPCPASAARFNRRAEAASKALRERVG